MRITLPNLTPGTTYVIKARSKSGADYSEWSRSITLTTSGDALPPKTPANPVGSMNGTSFSLKWDAVTQNSDSTALNDLDRYEVEVTSAGTATVGVYPTKDTKFEFSFEQNANLFGSPRANIKMRVRAVDLVGNASAYTSIVDQTNPAPAAPTGLAGNAGTYSLSFTWNAVADLDLKQYRIYSGTSAGTQSTLVWTGTALNATIQLVDTTTDRWYNVVAVDVFNTESTTSNVVGPIKPLSPVVVDVTPPAVPTNLAGTLTNATDGKTASMAVTWTGVADSDLDSYVVGFRQTATPVNDWQYITVDKATTSTTIQGLVPYKGYDIRIRAKDFSANYSNYTTIVAVSAQANTAPATVTGLAATAGKDNLQISWNENSELDVANNAGLYEVTVATNAGFTTGVLNYKTAATTLSINGLATNTQYFVRVRAIDSAGLASAAWSSNATATTSNFSGGSDGAVPSGAVTLSATAGIGYVYLSWTPLANADPLVYDVYMSTTSGFTTYDATTKITEVSGTQAFIDTTVAGASLAYGTTYYFRVRARDKDGVSASVSNIASAAPVKAAIGDIGATPRQLGVPIINTQATAPVSPISGDIWNDTTTGQEKVWTGSAWTLTGNVSDKYLTSKGTDLVTNGSALLGSNYNFTSFNFDGTDAPTGANGSFVAKNGIQQSAVIDEMIPFDPTKQYKFSFQARQTVAGQTNVIYGFLAPYDAYNLSISPQCYMYIAGTTTTLAADLKPGDTTIQLTSSTNWYGQAGKPAGSSTHLRGIIIWNYTDPGGKTWGVETYSRKSYLGLWNDGGITGNTITLNTPWPAGSGTIPAGTPLSNSSSGGSYMYMPSAAAVVVPETWKSYADVFNAGIMSSAAQAVPGGGAATWSSGMPPGTAKVKVGWLVNYPSGGTGKHAIAAVSLSDASAAQDAANNASKTYIQSSTPVGRTQDLWIDTTGGNNTPKRWNGSAWVAVTDKAATDAAAAATASSMTYIQSTAPTGRSQDLWIDTTAGANTPKRWNGSAWVAVTDQAAVAAAQTYTDTKFQATLKNSVVEYAMNASETVAPTTGWSTTAPARTPGNFIWYRTVLTFGDNSTTTSSAALLTGNTGATGSTGPTGATGPTGPAGTNGVSITGVTPYFYQVTPANGTAPTVTTPTASTPGAGWTTTEPTYVKDSALYRTERISYSNATYAYTAVYRSSAYDAAAAAQTTADGKNKIMRSTSDATGSQFADGDLWWKLDANGNVIKQWKFVVGGATPGWNVETLMDGVLGSLNANKIVAGTTFTQDLYVKSNFILGDATTPGVIKSYDYAANTTGFSLSSAGLQINNGDIDAKTLRANTSFVTTLFVGAGGAIQSTGFNASTGFQLSTSGLIIRGAGNSVDVAAVTAGTISGKQWIMGTGGSFIVDQTGYFQSNNYSATTGWRLDNTTGLTLNDGSVDAKALKTGSAIIGDLIIGRSADALGTIRSFDYSAGTAGWKIGKGLFEINQGTVRAAALQIQDSDNVMPPAFAGFEFTPSYYTNNMLNVANVTETIVSTGAKFQTQFMQIRATTAAAFDAYLGASTTDYNIVVDEPSVTYILSAWVKTGAVASTATLKVKLSNGTILTAVTQALPANGAWQRISGTIVIPAGITAVVAIVGCTTATVGAGVDIDGVQLERQMGGVATPSPWTAPGMTSVDAGVLRTGEIRSTSNVTVNSVTQPAWSINMSGGAQFGNAVVRGTMIVGSPGADVDAGQSFIASGNFVASTTGWKIDSAGNLEANQGLFRGSLNVGGRAGSSVSITAGDPIGIRAEMTDFGFKSYATGDEGTVYEAVSFGTASDNKLEIHNAAGDTVAGIDATGVVTAGGAALGSDVGPTFDTDGNFLTGVQIYGQEFNRIIDAQAKGIIASSFTSNFQVTSITTTFGLGEVSFTNVPGRNYRFNVNHANVTQTVATDRFVFTYRYTTDGTAPTITSPVFDRQIIATGTTTTMTAPPFISMRVLTSANATVRILVCLERISGTGSIQYSTNVPSVGYKAFHMWIEDIGLDVVDTFLLNQGNGQIGGGAAQPPPAQPKKTYVKTYTSTGSGSYRSTGVKRTDNGGKIYQGRSSAGSINGIQEGVYVFPDMTGDLSGATISKIEVYLYANFWYYNAGGTASISTHAHQTVPASNPAQTYRVASANWPKPGGRWVTLPNPSNTIYPAFQSGTIRGIGVYTTSTSLTLYGSFNSTAQIRVTYVK